MRMDKFLGRCCCVSVCLVTIQSCPEVFRLLVLVPHLYQTNNVTDECANTFHIFQFMMASQDMLMLSFSFFWHEAVGVMVEM